MYREYTYMYRLYTNSICSIIRKRGLVELASIYRAIRGCSQHQHAPNHLTHRFRLYMNPIIHHLLTTGMLGQHYSLFRFTPTPQSVAKRTASPRIVQRYVFQHELAQRSRHSGATTFFVVCDGNAQQTSNTPPNTQVMRSVSKGHSSTSISIPPKFLNVVP